MSPCCQFSPTLKQFREDLLNGNDQLRICLPICPEEWYVLCTQATLNFGCKRKCPFKACDCDSKTFQTLCFEHPNGNQPQEKKKKKKKVWQEYFICYQKIATDSLSSGTYCFTRSKTCILGKHSWTRRTSQNFFPRVCLSTH